MNDPSPRFTGIFIPVEILEMKNINALDKILLSWIDALYCKEHRGCFASNEYLAARLNVETNTVAKILTKLRKLNLIEDVAFDGRRRVIRSLINKFVEESHGNPPIDPIQGSIGFKSNAEVPIQCSIGQPSNPELDNHPSTPYIDSKDDRKEERGGEPPNPPLFSIDDKKIERALHVSTSEKEHQDLVKKFGSRIEACYQRLSEHKQDTPKAKWKKNDARSIQRWVIDAVKEGELKEKKREITELKVTEVEDEEHNRQWLKQVQEKYHGKIANEYIADSFDYAQFRNNKTNRDSEKIYFKDPKFKELVKHEINKRKLL